MKLKIVSIISALILILYAVVGCDGGGAMGTSADEASYSGEFFNLKVTFNLQEGSSSQEVEESGDQGEAPIEPEPSPAATDSLKEVIKRIRHSVVEIYATTASGVTSAGSGVVIATATTDPDSDSEQTSEDVVYSYIVTCYHVVENASTVLIKDVEGNEYEAKPVGADSDTDICVLSVEALLGKATVFDSDDVEVGEEVIAIGNPLGILGGTVTKGIISASSRRITVNGTEMDLIQTDAAINGGNSGGGLFTADGYLVGIVNAKYNGAYFNSVEGLAFAIPSTTVKEISTQLMETYTGEHLGYIPGKYYLGCNVANVWGSGWMTPSSVMISWLDKTGSFYKAGLRAGDQITSVIFGGKEQSISTAVAFSEYIDSLHLKVGDELVINVRREERFANSIRIEILQYICGEE